MCVYMYMHVYLYIYIYIYMCVCVLGFDTFRTKIPKIASFRRSRWRDVVFGTL